MSDTLTETVARLHRAGSENSKQTEKLRTAADQLLLWIKENVTISPLPCNCEVTPSGDFVRTALTNPPQGTHKEVLRMQVGTKHRVCQLSAFSQLIADGFLERLSEQMEQQNQRFGQTAAEVEKFLATE